MKHYEGYYILQADGERRRNAHLRQSCAQQNAASLASTMLELMLREARRVMRRRRTGFIIFHLMRHYTISSPRKWHFKCASAFAI